jgi:uncharacterized membrane protein
MKPLSATGPLPELNVKYRIDSIDVLRGLIMLVMALDHTRDFFHFQHPEPTDLLGTTPILFFTRWITHFCAPVFVFLSGISANLSGNRRTKKELSIFLFKRGIWLIFVELVLITFGLGLDPFFHVFVFQVLWVIGAGMVILACMLWLPLPVIALTGAVLFFGHDVINYLDIPRGGSSGFLLKLLFTASGSLHAVNANHSIFLFYALLPWTGVMLLGYAAGMLYAEGFDALWRRKMLYFMGYGSVFLFLVFRMINMYGDPLPWTLQPRPGFKFLSFLNVSKYPPSMLYLCMTLGPGLIFLAALERIKNKLTAFLKFYGSVPLFYYVLHLYLLRVINASLFFLQGFSFSDIVTPGQLLLFSPPAYGLGLGGVYLIWSMVVALLYRPCRWFSNYKRKNKGWWLSYL